MPYNQLKTPKKETREDVKTRRLLNISLIAMAGAILFGGFFIDWFISFFFGPIGCTVAIPSALVVAVIPIFLKRNLSAWLTCFFIILLCVAAYMGTALLLYLRHSGSYTDWLLTIFQYWKGLVGLFFEIIEKMITGKQL